MKKSENVYSRILTIRSQPVILDADLAELYGVETRRLNEQVKRNADRFPADFAFDLTEKEYASLKSQIATSNPQSVDFQYFVALRSQIATSKRGGSRKRPRAFAEHGALMAASVLNSQEAVTVSVFLVRAFVKMREELASNREILKRLAEIDKTLLAHDSALRDLYQKLLPLLTPPPPAQGRKIGFQPPED